MKSKLLILYSLFSIVSTNFCVQLEFPDAETIKKSLAEKNLDHFVEKTDLINELASKILNPIDVVTKIDRSMLAYAKILQKESSAEPTMVKEKIKQLENKRLFLFEVLFPKEVLAELKKGGLYRPNQRAN